MSAINNVISFYRLLNVASVTSAISGKVWRYNRPLNSTKVDVVISTPEYIGGAFNRVSVEVNVHSPNTTISVDGINDSTHPSVAKLQEVTDIITNILSGYDFTVKGKIIRDVDGHWFSNNIIKLEEIDPSLGLPAVIKELSSVDDNYGGTIVSESDYWQGAIAMVDISEGNQLNITAGTYRFNQRNEFIIPMVVQRNMIIETIEGRYTINGIKPMGGGLWKASAIRYDTKRS